MPDFGNLLVLNPKNRSKSSSGSLNLGQKSALRAVFCQKKSVQQAPKFGADLFYKPPFSALWATPPTQTQVEYLPGISTKEAGLFTLWNDI